MVARACNLSYSGGWGRRIEPRRWKLRWAEITPLHSSLGNKSETPSQKKKRKKKNLNIYIPCDWAVLLLGIQIKEMKMYVHTEMSTWVFIATLFVIANWGKPKYPSKGELINKLWYMYTIQYYSAIKRSKVLTHAQPGWISKFSKHYAEWKKLISKSYILYNTRHGGSCL